VKRRLGALLAALALPGCDGTPQPAGPSDASESPNASILPAPLATETPDLVDSGAASEEAGSRGGPAETAGHPLLLDASTPPPETMYPETPLPAEAAPYPKDASGVTLDAAFRWRDLPAPPRAPEVSADGLREAQKLTGLALKIDLAEAGRMRAELTGNGFLLPAHSELRARADHYGNLLVWPDGSSYRVIPPGALRALLGERRVDVMPLSPGAARPQGEGRRIGFSVRKLEISSSVATLRLELGKVPESGEGGALLCRALVELGGVDPRTPACQPGEVPLSASYSWQEGGGIGFEVTALTRRADLAASALLVPASSAAYLPAGLPGVPHGVFLPREAFAALRTAPVALPTSRDASVPTEGFVAVNHSDRVMYLLLDDIPAVAVPPSGEEYVVGPQRGRYLAQWRSFLGEKVAPPRPIEMPARLVHGGTPDAGAPDGG
jgi:hypothetical protein